jgi:hypothetical protein
MYSFQPQHSPPPLDAAIAPPSTNSFGFEFGGGDEVSSDLEGWLDNELADQIDEFALFLPPTSSSGGSNAMKDEFTLPSPKSLSTTTSFGLTLEDVYSDTLLVERAIPYLASTPSSVLPSVVPYGTSKLAMSVPEIPSLPQAQPSSQDQMYVSRVNPNAPEEYILSPLSSTVRRPQQKRKRNINYNKGDESYPTDGTLFKVIVDECVNKTSLNVPSLGMKSSEELMVVRNNRALARRKLTLKQIRRKENNFNGHYPDRKKVASSRKRVGGRFVKENKAVFRPAQAQATV